MVKLSTIPSEILCMILPLVPPEDFENFAQCCKEVRQQAERKKHNNAPSLLQEHRTLIRKYSDLTELADIGPYVRAMAANPLIARYVRKMEFGLLQPNLSSSISGRKDVFEDGEIYEFLVSAAKAIQIDSLLADSVALLVPLLPNLNALSFPLQSHGRFQWENHWIGKLANSSTPTLKKLRKLRIHSQCGCCPLFDLRCLAALPLLQTLEIDRLVSLPQQLWPQPHSQPRSHVKSLELWNCNMYTWMLDKYLQAFDDLESFAFRGRERNGHVLDPVPISPILLRHSRHTLTKLFLRWYDEHTTAKLSFKEFPNLKELSVDWQMLLPQPYSVGENWEPLLPQSLEALTIHDGSVWQEVREWNAQSMEKRFEPIVQDLISCKKSGLPGLREFTFTARGVHLVGFGEVELGFRSRCARAGLDFAFEEDEWRTVELWDGIQTTFGAQ